MSSSFGRPDSIRAVHQVPPAVEMSVTRSPSRVPFSRKLATAAFAWLAFQGVMFMSSNRRTNVRPRRSSGVVLIETRGGGGGVSEGWSGSCTASNETTVWGAPSSRMVRSCCLSPRITLPFLSVTTTSTMTCSTWAGNVGGGASWAAAGAAAAGGATGFGVS